MDFRKILIEENTSVLEALKRLDNTSQGILFIVRNEVLSASLSDGDIRRWLLKQGSLDAPVSSIANYNPKYIKDSERFMVQKLMRKYRIDTIPIVNDKHEIIDIVFQNPGNETRSIRQSLNLPVVLMAGGKGTRLYPYTKILPKPLIPIGDIPILEHIVNLFHGFGCNDFYIIVNYKKNMIKAYFNEIDYEYHINYIDEPNPLGTGGGVSLLKGIITSTFILSNCDSIITEDYSKILKEHREKGNLVTMICSLRNYEVPYGVVEIGENGSIKEMTEKPSMSFFTNTGAYIVEPEVIDYIEPYKPVGFPDIIRKVKDDGKNVGVYPINENSWLDMGQFDTMENMKQRLHLKD